MSRRAHKPSEAALAPPHGLVARRFRVGPDQYVLFELPLPEVVLPATLTEAESDVTRRIVNGEPLAEIARARRTSPHTITNQLRSVYQKLGVSSRVELARACSSLKSKPQRKI